MAGTSGILADTLDSPHLENDTRCPPPTADVPAGCYRASEAGRGELSLPDDAHVG